MLKEIFRTYVKLVKIIYMGHDGSEQISFETTDSISKKGSSNQSAQDSPELVVVSNDTELYKKTHFF